MAVAGYNFYLKKTADPGDRLKNNSSLSASPTYTPTGLASGTQYDISSTAVDGAGNESPHSNVLTVTTTQYTPPPTDPVMSTADKAAIDAIIDDDVHSSTNAGGQIPGILLAITGPRGSYAKAYGHTRLALTSPPLTTDMHFRMGSVTKTFTGTAAFQAIDAGQLSLDDTLDSFSVTSAVPNANIITIRHLLQMRSGVYEFTSDWGLLLQIALNPAGAWSEEQSLNLIRNNPSQFAPGSQYTYENSNAILIGAVLEEIHGRAMKDIIADDIIAPLGLTETSWPTGTTIPLPTSSDVAYNPEITGAAGCMVSTIGDLSRWVQELRDETLLSTASKTLRNGTFPQAAAIAVGQHPPNYLAYGHFLFSYGEWVGHDGSIKGSKTGVMFHPPTGATIAINANASGGDPVFFSAANKIAAYLYPGSMADQTYPKP